MPTCLCIQGKNVMTSQNVEVAEANEAFIWPDYLCYLNYSAFGRSACNLDLDTDIKYGF